MESALSPVHLLAYFIEVTKDMTVIFILACCLNHLLQYLAVQFPSTQLSLEEASSQKVFIKKCILNLENFK